MTMNPSRILHVAGIVLLIALNVAFVGSILMVIAHFVTKFW